MKIFSKIIIFATIIMVVQGLSFLRLSGYYPFGSTVLVRDRNRGGCHRTGKSKWTERMLSLHEAQYETLTQSIEQTKTQRHDLRHQLTVIRSYSENGNNNKLTNYLDTLIAEIPDRQSAVYCENAAINAIVSHYAALAEKKRNCPVCQSDRTRAYGTHQRHKP